MGAMFGAAIPLIQDSGYVEYVVAVLVIHLLMIIFFIGRRPRNLPPGPTGLPIIGSLHLLGPRPHARLAQMAPKYQPLMSLYLGQKLCIVATSPETAMEFLKAQDAVFSSRPCLRAAEIIFPKDISFSDLTPEAKRMRKLLHSELVSARRIEETQHIRADEMAHMVRTIPSGAVVNIKTHLDAMTANVFTRLVIGKRLHDRDDAEQGEFIEITDEIDLLLGTPNPRDAIPALGWLDGFTGLDKRYRSLRERMELFLNKVIAEHRRDDERAVDFLDAMLQEMDRTDGDAISLQAVTSIVWEAFAAGMETSALVSEWTLAEVLRNPRIQSNLHAELDAVVGRARPVREADIADLPYLRATVKESLRLHPIIPTLVPHQSTAPSQAFGFHIPANTQLMVNAWAIGRDARVWGSDALEFRPERFLEDPTSMEIAEKRFEMLPFGSGRRMCMGMALGVALVEMGVANLLQCFEWAALDGEVDMTEGVGLSAKKEVPLCAVASARLPADVFA